MPPIIVCKIRLAVKCTRAAQVLAGRKTTGTIRGDIWVNGHPKVQDTFKRVCGYVEQFGAPPGAGMKHAYSLPVVWCMLWC